jgi:hypothetical protein
MANITAFNLMSFIATTLLFCTIVVSLLFVAFLFW